MKYALPAIAAALALAGCDSTAEPAAEDTAAVTMDDGTMAAPAATETVVATPGATPGATMTTDSAGTATVTTGADGTSVTVDGRDVDATVGPEGATATVTPDR